MEEHLKQVGNSKSNCIKIVFYGPESTGKSTLVKALAAYFNTVYVEEYARIYAETKAKSNIALTKADVLPIAIGQMAAENKQYKHANKLLICDTDLLETMVYSEHYYAGFCPDDVKVYAYKNSYDLYFLSYIDVVWKADGIRDQPEHRGQLFNRFEQALIDSKKPYVVVKGEFEERLNFCKVQIKNLLKDTY